MQRGDSLFSIEEISESVLIDPTSLARLPIASIDGPILANLNTGGLYEIHDANW